MLDILKAKYMKLALTTVLVTLLILGICTSAQEPPSIDNVCPSADWSKADATSSLQTLIKGQMGLIVNFTSLLHEYKDGLTGEKNATFLASYEDLLRKQSVLHTNYAGMLGNENSWDFSNPSDQVMFLTNYTEILSAEKVLYGDFYDLLNATWCNSSFKAAPGACGINTHREFLYSFQDLLTRQENLLTYYYYLTKNLDSEVSILDKLDFVSSYEGLIRWHSLKIRDLENLMQNPCTEYS